MQKLSSRVDLSLLVIVTFDVFLSTHDCKAMCNDMWAGNMVAGLCH